MMELVIDTRGQVRCVYNEAIDLTALGRLSIRRASYVEPDEQGRWWADLSLIGGGVFGPFPARSAALDAELTWLSRRLSRCSCWLALKGVRMPQTVSVNPFYR